MVPSYDLEFDEFWPIISQVRTILDARRERPRHWWERIRHERATLKQVSQLLGTGFFDSLVSESRSTLETELCMLFGQYRVRMRQRLDTVRQQVDQLIYDYKTGCPVDFTAERYNLKGQARIYRSVLAGMTSPQDLEMWIGHPLSNELMTLDLAAGTGQIGNAVFRETACRRMTADLSQEMLKDGRRSGYLAGTLPCVARAESLPLVNGSIDLALLIFGIDTVDRPRQVLVELSRALSATGRLLIATPLPLRSVSDGITIIPDQELIGQGQEWLEDAITLARYLESLGLAMVRWGVTTYYHCDIRGLKQSCAFVFLVERNF